MQNLTGRKSYWTNFTEHMNMPHPYHPNGNDLGAVALKRWPAGTTKCG